MTKLARIINAVLSLAGFQLSRTRGQPNLRSGCGETNGDAVNLPNYSVDCIIDVGVAGGTPWLYTHFNDKLL